MTGKNKDSIEVLKKLVPQPIHEEAESGMIVWYCGYPIELVVRIGDQFIPIDEFMAKWEGPHTLMRCPDPVGLVAIADVRSIDASMFFARMKDFIYSSTRPPSIRHQRFAPI